MNRRDVIIFLLLGIWGLFVWLGLPEVATTSRELIAVFTLSMLALLLCLILLMIFSFAIKKFGAWGDKWIIKP